MNNLVKYLKAFLLIILVFAITLVTAVPLQILHIALEITMAASDMIREILSAINKAAMFAMKKVYRGVVKPIMDHAEALVKAEIDMSKVTRAEVPGTGKSMDELRREDSYE